MVIRVGLEPTTPSLRGSCSNQLSYRTDRCTEGRKARALTGPTDYQRIISQFSVFVNPLRQHFSTPR